MSFQPELGQFAFGNKWERNEFPVEFAETLSSLCYLATGEGCYADDFDNETFVLRPYYWGDCELEEEEGELDCGQCSKAESCRVVLPNFEFGDVHIHWYKHCLRSVTCDKELPLDEWRKIFLKCFNSLEETP